MEFDLVFRGCWCAQTSEPEDKWSHHKALGEKNGWCVRSRDSASRKGSHTEEPEVVKERATVSIQSARDFLTRVAKDEELRKRLGDCKTGAE